MEIKTAERINSGGFAAHCPVYQKKLRRGYFFRSEEAPLFSSWIFIGADAAFRKDKFETTKVRLTVFRKQLITGEQMKVINSTAEQLSAMQANSPKRLVIKRHDVMEILFGAMRGEPVEVLALRGKNLVRVQLLRFPTSLPVDVKVDALGRCA